MPGKGEPFGNRVLGAAARTVAERTARLSGAWSKSSVPEDGDQRCEGVADFAARRARVEQVMLGTAGIAAALIGQHQNVDDGDLRQLGEPVEMIYDGANAYQHVFGVWTGFSLGDRSGPRGVNDPLWPLDALFGAADAVDMGAGIIRGVATTRYGVRIDLARADAVLLEGVSVPAGPYRGLGRFPGEVWLDEAGRARRIAVISEPVAGHERQTWLVVDLWDFGVNADIRPPRPEDVVPPREAFRERPDAAPETRS